MARTWPYAPLNLAQVADDPNDIDVPMPSPNHQELLIQLYFTYVHPELPILHKSTFMKQYQAGFVQSNGVYYCEITDFSLFD